MLARLRRFCRKRGRGGDAKRLRSSIFLVPRPRSVAELVTHDAPALLLAARLQVRPTSQNANSWRCGGMPSEQEIVARRVKACKGAISPTTSLLIQISKTLVIADTARMVNATPSPVISKLRNRAEGFWASATTSPACSKVQWPLNIPCLRTS